jgi:hypothetical protein
LFVVRVSTAAQAERSRREKNHRSDSGGAALGRQFSIARRVAPSVESRRCHVATPTSSGPAVVPLPPIVRVGPPSSLQKERIARNRSERVGFADRPHRAGPAADASGVAAVVTDGRRRPLTRP